jgi:Protein of unknown function (DUF4065)
MQYNARKARKMILWVAQKLRLPEMPFVWAVIYLAERHYLAHMGVLMMWDTYVAMRHGPVPLRTFAELHQGVMRWRDQNDALSLGGWLKNLANEQSLCDLEKAFTPKELECLEWAFWEANRLGFAGLERLVKGHAWRLAGPDGLLDPLEIAKEGGASDAELHFIQRWSDPPPRVELMHLQAG